MSTANTFNSLQGNFKEQYPKKERFKKLRSALKSKGKATAELDASKDPMSALRDKSYLNLKGKKGIAL